MTNFFMKFLDFSKVSESIGIDSGRFPVLQVIVCECLELVGLKSSDRGGVTSPEKMFDLGGGAPYPLRCKFLAR